MTLRFNDGGFTIVEKLSKALREILQHWRLSLASLLFYILLSLLTNVSRESLLVLAAAANNMSTLLPCSESSAVPSLLSTKPSNCTEQLQCFLLQNETDAMDICKFHVDCRTRASLEFNLNKCRWRTRTNLVDVGNNKSDCLSMKDEGNCSACLKDLLDRDLEVEKHYQSYSSILKRYDCDRNYSMWGCEECKVVYKDWLCGLSFGFYNEGQLIKPCLGFCYLTSKKCPFLLPSVLYCGTQSYFCPKVIDLFENSTFAHQPPCYEYDCKNGTECTPEVTNRTDPTASSTSSTTKASITSLLIGQLVLLWISRTLFDLPVGFA